MTRKPNLKPPEERAPNDAYMTPEACAQACVDWVLAYRARLLQLPTPKNVIEPACGSGAFVRALESHGLEVTSVDIAPRSDFDPTYVCDFTCLYLGDDDERCDLIIGNPPYNQAQAFVDHALSMLAPNGTLAFLLRATFQGAYPTRGEWLFGPGRPTKSVRLYPRPSFNAPEGRKGKTDGCEYDLVVWQNGVADSVEYLRWR